MTEIKFTGSDLNVIDTLEETKKNLEGISGTLKMLEDLTGNDEDNISTSLPQMLGYNVKKLDESIDAIDEILSLYQVQEID